MNEFQASAFIKTGSCLRYLVDTREGAAIGKAWPDANQSENDYVNSKMEKIQESANVLDNMKNVETLLRDIGFKDVRENAQKHLKDVLIPAAILIMRKDNDHGKLTEELATQINHTAREIRKGVLEHAKGLKLYDESEDTKSWPKEFDSKLIWPIPWWLIVWFFTLFTLGITVTHMPIYDKAIEYFTPKNVDSPETSQNESKDGNTATQPSQSETPSSSKNDN